LELYGFDEKVRAALQSENFAEAAQFVQAAMKESHYRAKYNCAPIGPAAHVAHFTALREFRRCVRAAGGL